MPSRFTFLPVEELTVWASLELWFWPVRGVSLTAQLTLSFFVLIAIVGRVWRSRIRAARRNAALEAYANREIARARTRKAA
jgi:hypothetical protein